MNWSRAILAGATVLVAVSFGWWWFFVRSTLPEYDGSQAGLVETPAAPKEPAVPLGPLPTLTVAARDATVEVALRGNAPDAGCATRGLDAPLCPGQYDVKATSGTQLALAVVRLNRGDGKHL